MMGVKFGKRGRGYVGYRKEGDKYINDNSSLGMLKGLEARKNK